MVLPVYASEVEQYGVQAEGCGRWFIIGRCKRMRGRQALGEYNVLTECGAVS